MRFELGRMDERERFGCHYYGHPDFKARAFDKYLRLTYNILNKEPVR